MIKMSQSGRVWLAFLEGGVYLVPYQDGNGVWTIGVGSTYWPDGREVKETDRLDSYEEGMELFDTTLRDFEEGVSEALLSSGVFIRNGGPFPAHVTDALISFSFNIGIPRFRKSTALKRFNENFSLRSVAEAMSWWKRPNLSSRRTAERRCLIDGVYVDQGGLVVTA